jgi:adhesin transport system membrane fusion protein
VTDLRGELSSAELAIPLLKSALQEAKDKLEGSKLAFQSEALKQLNEVRLEIQRMAENSDDLEDKVNRTLVVSPVAGTIKTVEINTIGGVIQPGMDIFEIVPTEDSLMVEAKIRQSDIAYMHPGQAAIVKVTAYDFAIHGGLDGELVHISPDTIVDEEGNSFYLVRIKTNKSYLGTDEKQRPIISGMTVSVDVLTGEKTVLSYVLKPILKTKQLALRER